MDKDFIIGSLIWATAATIVLCTGLGVWVTNINNTHDFERLCIEHGKSVVYTAHLGDSTSSRECK